MGADTCRQRELMGVPEKRSEAGKKGGNMRKTISLVSLALVGVLASSPSGAALLESPAQQAVVSGIGFIGG